MFGDPRESTNMCLLLASSVKRSLMVSCQGYPVGTAIQEESCVRASVYTFGAGDADKRAIFHRTLRGNLTSVHSSLCLDGKSCLTHC